MRRLVPMQHEPLYRLGETPEVCLLRLGLLLSLLWESCQSPFYTDTFTASWSTLVSNRLHCAGGDALILLVAFWLFALRWGRCWLNVIRWRPLATFLVIGVAYTTLSEYVNVSLVQRWAYSQWMPTIGNIGIIPLLQWVIVPTLSVLCASRQTPLCSWQRRQSECGGRTS